MKPTRLTNPVLLDEDGYAVVHLVNYERVQQGIKERRAFRLENESFKIPVKHIEMVDSGKLTADTILDMEYSEILRLATYKPAAKAIYDFINIRGVYLKNEHKGADGVLRPTVIKPHQVKTLAWMKARESAEVTETRGVRGGIVSLTMGLGKTLVSLLHILSSPKGKFPSLVICSKTVMINWAQDGINKFFGTGEQAPKVLFIHKDFMKAKAIDNIDRAMILTYDIVVTSYDMCMTACKKNDYYNDCVEMGDERTLMKGKIVSIHERTRNQADLPHVTGAEVIYGTPWERVICDESQQFANPSTQKYKCIMAIHGKYKWCLTGTPIRNYDTDIWAQLRFCGYTGVTEKNQWKRKGSEIFKAHKLLDAVCTMDYKDAGEKLPPKTKRLVTVNLTGRQLEVYNYMLGVSRDAYYMMMENLCSFSCVLALFTRLRQCAIAPYLMTAQSKREKVKRLSERKTDIEALDIIKNMIKNKNNDLGIWCHDRDGEAGIYSAKMTELVNTIAQIPKDEKILVFSMFTSCLDLLAYALEKRLPELNIVQIDGDTVGEERASLIDKFNNSADIRAALFTYKVGGEGLNLTVATHCICIEPWWTAAVPAQAEARCWRIGQTKPVFIHDIITNGTIEPNIIDICNGKGAMAASYLEGTIRSVGRVGLDKFTLGRILGIN